MTRTSLATLVYTLFRVSPESLPVAPNGGRLGLPDALEVAEAVDHGGHGQRQVEQAAPRRLHSAVLDPEKEVNPLTT